MATSFPLGRSLRPNREILIASPHLNLPRRRCLINGLIRKTILACSILVALAAASFVVPINANAEDLRNVSCSVHVDFLFNNLLRATYQRDFVVSPGVDYDEDISTLASVGSYSSQKLAISFIQSGRELFHFPFALFGNLEMRFDSRGSMTWFVLPRFVLGVCVFV